MPRVRRSFIGWMVLVLPSFCFCLSMSFFCLRICCWVFSFSIWFAV